MTTRATQALVAEGRIEKVPVARAQAARLLQSCARHIDDLVHLDRMRRVRHDAEYDARPLTEREVRVDLAHAREIVRAVTRVLFPPKSG